MLAHANAAALLPAALEQMRTRILEFVEVGGTAAYLKKAVACTAELRAACVAHGESELFNDFLRGKLKAKFRDSDFWDRLVAAKTTLITEDEDSAVAVTAAEAAAFIAEEAEDDAAVEAGGPAGASGGGGGGGGDDDDDDGMFDME